MKNKVVKKRMPHGHWNKFENCLEAALKCKTRNEFRLRFYSAVYSLNKMGRLEEACSHMKGRLPNNYWTKELCREKAIQCSSKKEFRVNFQAAYFAALKNKWMGDISSHMNLLGSKKLRFIYTLTSGNKIYIGITCDPQKREQEHRTENKYSTKEFCGIFDFTLLTTSPIKLKEACDMEVKLIKQYRGDEKWHVVNRSNGGDIGGRNRMWTKESCMQVAKTYEYRSEFKKAYSGAYRACIRNKWLKDVTAHMGYKKRHKDGYWNKDTIMEAAKKCKSYNEFTKLYRSAYVICLKEGFSKEIKQLLKN